MARRYVIGALAGAIYILAIYMANLLIVHVGFIYVWPLSRIGHQVPAAAGALALGIAAPAGVYCAGLTFPLRDLVQRAFGSADPRLGYAAGGIAIVVAAGLTMVISPRLALASGVTFLVSETVDMTFYSWMQRRFFTVGVITSSVIAAVVDSLLFLHLAHIPYSVALKGQVIGKLEVIFLVGFPLTVMLRRRLPLPAARPVPEATPEASPA